MLTKYSLYFFETFITGCIKPGGQRGSVRPGSHPGKGVAVGVCTTVFWTVRGWEQKVNGASGRMGAAVTPASVQRGFGQERTKGRKVVLAKV